MPWVSIYTLNKLGIVVHPWNPRTQEVEARESEVQGDPLYTVNSRLVCLSGYLVWQQGGEQLPQAGINASIILGTSCSYLG